MERIGKEGERRCCREREGEGKVKEEGREIDRERGGERERERESDRKG